MLNPILFCCDDDHCDNDDDYYISRFFFLRITVDWAVKTLMWD